jgi:cell division protein ZapA
MSVKTSAEVVIGGKVYTLSGYEGEDYLQRVAAYINNKLNEFEGTQNYKNIHPSMKETLIQLNIADDYFKARSQVEKLEKEIESKDKEIYDLKHDLISNQVKTESAEEALKKVREENRELLLNKARLESALEEKLLDTDKDKEKEKTASSSRKK